MTHYLSDNNSYSKPDSGCEWASRVLGKQPLLYKSPETPEKIAPPVI